MTDERSNYADIWESSGVVRILKDLDRSIEGRHVIIVENTIDTGLTLHYLRANLRGHGPASVEIAPLLDKKEVRKRKELEDMGARYVGFECPNEFVVGYGLDYGRYRNLPFIGVLRPEIYSWMSETHLRAVLLLSPLLFACAPEDATALTDGDDATATGDQATTGDGDGNSDGDGDGNGDCARTPRIARRPPPFRSPLRRAIGMQGLIPDLPTDFRVPLTETRRELAERPSPQHTIPFQNCRTCQSPTHLSSTN